MNVYVAIGLIILFSFLTFLFVKKYYQVQNIISQQKIDNEIILENQKLQSQNENLKNYKSELVNSINDLEQQAKQSGQIFLAQNLQLAKEKLETTSNLLKKSYEDAGKEYQEEYLQILKNCAEDVSTTISLKKQELSQLNIQLDEYKSKTNAAIEAFRREEEKKLKNNFYKLILPEEDLREILSLKEVSHMLRNPEALNKVIWKVYYEKPYSDLIGRVIDNKIKCGIYKITNLTNNMCYVGQAVNIAERWRQHIKRGLGAETPTRNKLYPAMMSIGVENFSFEIIEECSRDSLDAREDYWQDYFKAKEFGYSIK